VVIGDEYRKCVVFLFVDVPDPETGQPKRTPAGTAFLAGIPAEAIDPSVDTSTTPSPFYRYLVTARHVIALSRRYGSLFARIHLANGPAFFMEVPPEAWHEHPVTEVAVALLRLSGAPIDHVLIAIEQFAIDSKVVDYRIATGDEVFFVGLFSEHPGVARNQPILRFGNISLMPDEKLLVNLGDSTARIRAYLVEARSWGGHSGSPAFVYFPPDRFGNSISVGMTLPIFLLGLVQGHYDIESDVKFIGDVGEGRVSMNAGIAAVVPAQEIHDLLMSEEVVDERQAAQRTIS
jgi:hypothetical protein